MASGLTNRGKKLLQTYAFGSTSAPSTYYGLLCSDSTTPTNQTNTISDLSEIPNGNGYTTGGVSITRGTDFTITEDDTNNLGKVVLKTLLWTASGGSLPASGNGARWLVLTDDSTPKNIIAWFDLVSNRSVSVGQSLSILASEIDIA